MRNFSPASALYVGRRVWGLLFDIYCAATTVSDRRHVFRLGQFAAFADNNSVRRSFNLIFGRCVRYTKPLGQSESQLYIGLSREKSFMSFDKLMVAAEL